ncbi:MAG: hypothetical protein JW779_12280 [Candidatus Thorarchaeota archaeon]|nr:hypothetical protein [Candidatus Thorarchaeota archaeon]
MTLASNITEFKCRVCGKQIQFDPKDPSSYLSKSEHEDFFGMKLTTFRIAHDSKDERHYNTVIVDQAGFFRGHRDAYTEPINELKPSFDREYWVFHEEGPTIEKTHNVALAVLISRSDRWVIDIVCPRNLNASHIATLVVDRVEEAWRVYDSIPRPLDMRVADMEMKVWSSESRVLCVCFTNGSLMKSIDSVAEHIVNERDGSIIPRRRNLNVIFRILESDSNLDPSILSRIINEDMLFATLHTPYEDRIPSIVERTASRYPIAGELLGPLLRGYITLIEALEGDFSSRYKEVFELIDFVNRRRILG